MFVILGILNQDKGVLVIYKEVPVDNTYELALETVHALGDVLDGLFRMAKKLNW